jgi:hypothetical protein
VRNWELVSEEKKIKAVENKLADIWSGAGTLYPDIIVILFTHFLSWRDDTICRWDEADNKS